MRLRVPLVLSLGFLLACIGPRPREDAPIAEPDFPAFDSEEGGDSATPNDTDDTEVPELSVDEAPSGDLSCFSGTLESPASTAAGDVVLDVRVRDWETGDTVGNPTVDFSGLGSVEGDSDGELGKLELPACVAITATLSTAAELDETKPTTHARMLTPSASDWTLSSLSKITWQIIPSLLGVQQGPGRGMVLGRVADCSGEPLDHVQVVWEGGGGGYYFVDEFPNRDQLWTSDDGFFAVLNAPAGSGQLSAWAWDGSSHVKVAGATLEVAEDSVRIVELRAAERGDHEVPEDCR